ncbi:hypothetical protein ACLQ18_39785 [Streptomyces sp. DT193]|uniref:hypothetical protein n=1 Tax=Streptomyces sp. DT193 TaxID=3393418 RepID=UPI003CF17309
MRVDEPVLSDAPILQYDLQLSDSWWNDLAGTLEKVAAVDTDRIAVRQQYMERAIPEFVGIPAPAVSCWTTAHADVHWANLTSPLRLLDWEGWRSGAPFMGERSGFHPVPGQKARGLARSQVIVGLR